MSETPDIIAWTREGSIDALKKFLATNPDAANSRTAEGISLLMLAVYHRNQQLVDLIKSHKSALDIFEAVSTGEEKLVRRLTEANPSVVNLVSPDGFSPLGYACFFNQPAIARYLVEQGADVGAASNNNFKVTPLHSASAISSYELVEYLLAHGADVHARQASGFTALHSAAFNGKPELVKLLLDAGANIRDKTDEGETALMLAEKNNQSQTAAYLRSRDAH
ncbi:MAG TPA: ankyrin repeat domain-containing protein [Puia sp.]|nr:ankyrin repeat domain-containing protein [Puia sp.]